MTTYAVLKKLMDRPSNVSGLALKDLEPSIQALGETLAKGRSVRVGRAGVSIYEGEQASHYCLDLIEGECRISKQPPEDARFSISVAKETWAEIASGEISPMDAFLMGRMAISGDISFARRLYATLAAKPGRTDV